MLKIILIDNFDSFTYNLVHYLETNAMVKVIRSNEINLNDIKKYNAIVLSPGPGLPQDYPKMLEVIEKYQHQKPILGVCLGHQAIAVVNGAKLINLQEVWHGIARDTYITNEDDLFKDIPPVIKTGRYHSWVVDELTLPADFIITSRDSNSAIMSLKHSNYPLKSVQFHPKSILTPHGKKIIQNWINFVKKNI
jgi:anthranilate synthase component 2